MTSDATSSAELSPVKRALLEIRELRSRIAQLEGERAEPIAIVGMSVRAPGGVTDPESFARMLWAGTDAITDIPASRWRLDEWFDEGQDTAGRMYTRYGGFLDDVDQFDAEFFGIAPVEAASMDPQQRLVLELAWQALEDSGHAPSSLAGTSAGIYLGISNSDYGRALLARPELIDPYFSPGSAFSVAAGRVSYVLGMHGPAISVDTACSSSLVSLHLACQGLRNGECNLALAGGVNLILTPELNINFSKAGMMSRDGRCRTFDADGAGYVRGEGGGMVVLRRLRDAMADGDRILAVVRGSAVNQDGRSNGLTAPNGPAQEAVVRAALALAGIAPSQVGYIEAHGTGTSLGDPIEVNALSAVLSDGRTADTPLRLGSVKTNIGHLEAAAGIAGVIKTVIALQRKELPPHLHFSRPNPYIDWSAMPMEVPTQITEWSPIGGRLIAGVSSFGFSGTNAHVVLEAAPDVETSIAAAPPTHVLALSARDATALRGLALAYRDRVQALPGDDGAALADLCHTANSGRSHQAHRLSVSGETGSAIAAGIDAWLHGTSHPRVLAGVAGGDVPRIAFMFPGQGPQYVGMGRQLYDTLPEFRRAFDACAAVLDPMLPQPILPIVFPADADATLLNQTAYAQPAMFAIEYALASLWRSWGVSPAAVMGHSFGEYAAACVAGVVSLADAAKMVVTRGRLVAALPGDGLMVVVEASETEVTDAIGLHGGVVAIAAINGPTTCVISGVRADVNAIAEGFTARGRRTKALRVSHGFHSPLMDPVLDEFERELSTIQYSAPATSIISNLTGSVADLATIGHARYWRDHLRNPVRFSQSIQVLAAQRITHFVELSPHPVLLSMAAECVSDGVWLPSLREDQGAWSEMLLTLQRLYVDGAAINWAAVTGGEQRRRVALPTYPFQRKRHWIDAIESAPVKASAATAPVDFWSTVLPSLSAQAMRGPLDLNAASYTAKWDCLARLTSALVQQTLRDLGVFVRKGESHTIDTVLDVTGILPAHRQLVSRWLQHLVRDGVLRQDGGVFMPRDTKPKVPIAELWAEAEQRFGDNREMLDYVKNCARLLPGIITGRESALESLFPNGSFDLATALYEQSATMRYINGLAAAGFEAVGRAIPAGRVLRVLEIGAGTGGTSSSLLRVLPADRTDYLFTDVSDAFLERARSRFAGVSQIRYGLYDLEIEPEQQGYTAGQFDLIVSANCVHASKDLRAVLARLCGLLAPGGLLMLVESTQHFDFFDITTGLIEGWQAFADDLRTDNPLLAPEGWTGAMLTAGFVSAQAWPALDSVASSLGQHVIVARAPGDSTPVANVVTGTAVVHDAPIAAVTPAVNDFRERLAASLVGDRTSMLCDAVRGEVMRILRLDPTASPSRQDRLMDLGMDSLMAVQLRNALSAMLELERPLPSTLIFDYPTIDAIAAFLLERSGMSGTAAAAVAGAPLAPAPRAVAAQVSHAPTLAASTIAAMSDEEIAAALLAREGGA